MTPADIGIQGGIPIGNAAYHDDVTAMSATALDLFRDSPKLYHGTYITKTIERQETDAFTYGSAFHTKVLEPSKFDEEYAVAPERWKLNTKEGKAALAAFEAATAPRKVLWPEEGQIIEQTRRNLFADPMIDRILAGVGLIEHAFYADLSGVKCKCKPDWIVPWEGGILVVDFKTVSGSVSANEFGRACANFGYHRKSAFYLEVVRANNPGRDVGFVHIACSKKAPYEVKAFQLTAADLGLGASQVAAALSAYTLCRDMDVWATNGAGRINTVELPKYAHYQ